MKSTKIISHTERGGPIEDAAPDFSILLTGVMGEVSPETVHRLEEEAKTLMQMGFSRMELIVCSNRNQGFFVTVEG